MGSEDTVLDEGGDGRSVLRIASLTKTFPGTKALDGVAIEIRAGEVHALVGHNGSGKSTLIKCLSGYHAPDPGAEFWWHGAPVDAAHLAGGQDRMRFVHQDLGLVNELSAADNLALRAGYSRGLLGGIDWRKEEATARELVGAFGIDLHPRTPLAKATPVERTIVAIAIALRGWDPDGGLLVLDEPTAVLSPNESARLFEVVEGLRERGAAILYVSHRLREIFDLGDRVTVLRGGRLVGTREIATLKQDELVAMMLGTAADGDYRARLSPPRETTLLEVEDLRGRFLRGASFALREGEVLGVAGLPDDGRVELPRILSDGVPYPVSGRVRAPAVSRQWSSLGDWRAERVALVPPDRTRDGVIAQMSVGENLTLSTLDRFGPPWMLHEGREREFAERWVGQLDVKAAGVDQPVATLSGGNQQKVLIGRALAREPRVLVLCEPTAGVDIGARHAIFDLVAERAADGLGVLVSSSDVDDLIGLCTRVLVLRDGTIAAELTGEAIDERRLLPAMEGLGDAG